MRFISACLLFLCFVLAPALRTNAQVANDIGVTAIDSPTTVFCGANQLVYARVVNQGSNPVDSFVLNWSLNGILQTPVNCYIPLDTTGGAGSTQAKVFLGNHTFLLNMPVAIKAWTTLPNAQTDGNTANDSASATRTLMSLKGTYTIDPAGSGGSNFATITDAIAALTTYGVCGPVTFHIAAGTYTRITPITLVGGIAGASLANRITFKGTGAATCIFTGTLANSGIIVINQSRYITFRDLRVENLSGVRSSAIAVVGSSSNISVINCNLSVPVLLPGGQFSGGLIFTGAASGIGASNCSADSVFIDSNITSGGYHGILIQGIQTAGFNRNIIITNNTVNQASSNGIHLANICSPLTLTGNTVWMNRASVLPTNGILFSDNVNSNATQSHIISRNRVFDFRNGGISCSNFAVSGVAAPTVVTNNIVAGESTDITGNIAGIRMVQSNFYHGEVYHNTVVVGAKAVTTPSTAGAFLAQGSHAVNVKNNVFVVTGGGLLNVNVPTTQSSTSINHNLYYHPDPAANIVRINVANYTAANFRTPLGGGDSSYYAAPAFDKNVPDSFAINQACLLGVNLGIKVPYDFTNKLRGVRPTVGAYEYSSLADNLSVLDIIAPKTTVLPGAHDLKYRVMNMGNNPVMSYRASYYSGINPVRSILLTDTLFPCTIDTITFAGADQLIVSDSTPVTAYTSLPNNTADTDPTGDTVRMVFKSALKGIYTVGGINPDFATPQAAGAALTARGIWGHVYFDIRPGSYLGQVTLSAVGGVADTATITFDGGNADSALITADVSTGAFQVLQTGYVTIRNLSVTNVQDASGVLLYCPTPKRIINLSVVKCKITSLAAAHVGKPAFTGINVTGAATFAPGASACDSVLIDSNTIKGFGTGVFITGAQDTLQNRGVRITNNHIQDGWIGGINVASVYNPVSVINNTLRNRSSAAGITYNTNKSYHTTQQHIIARNRIYHFGTTGIACTSTGVNNTAAPALIVNNELYSSTLATVAYGINVSNMEGPARTYVYNNTVVMKGTSTSTPRAAVYTAGSVNTEIKNNILAILSGSYFPVYLVTNTPGKVVNYNLYYNKVSNILGYRNGSNFITNPGSYRQGTNGGDSSVNLVPPFYSMDSATLDLALRHKCFGKGVDMPFLATDVNGAPRTLPVAMGAYEVRAISTGISLDTLFSPGATATLQRGSYDVKFVVRNTGVDTITQYQAAYTHNNNAPVTISRLVNLPSCVADTVIFTAGNAINLVATNELQAYIYNPNNVTDPYRWDDTIVRVILPPMKGLYTIGGAGSDFATLDAAFAAATARSITNPVEFRFNAGEYNGPFTINSTVPGHNSINRITISGVARNLVQLKADTLGPVVRINTMKYITLKDLTVKNTQAGIGVAIVGSLGNNAATGCTIKNCRIELPDSGSGTAANAGIRIANNTYTVSNNTAQLDSITIDSNSIKGGSFGIVMYGTDNALHNRKITITGNTVDTVLKSGIYMVEVRNAMVISLNTITRALDRGIYMSSMAATGTHYITRNRVYNFGYAGLYIANPVSSVSAKTEIVNNIVVSADSTQAANGTYGIYVYHNNASYNANVYHNTVVMRGTHTSSIASAFYNYGSREIAVKNNIFAVYNGGYSSLYMSDGSPNVVANMYYVANAAYGRILGRNNGDFNEFNYLDRGGWGSSIGAPQFADLNRYIPDLRLVRACATQSGTNTGEVPADIEGAVRADQPTVGAFEKVAINIAAIHIAKFATPVVIGAQELKLAVKNFSTDTLHSLQAGYTNNGSGAVLVNVVMNLPPCAVDTVTFSGINQPVVAHVNDFTAFVSLPNGLTGSYTGDDTIRKHVVTAMSGTYTIGGTSPDFNTFTDAVNALESEMIGPVRFLVRPGEYKERIVLNDPPLGASKTNTLTFEGTDAATCILNNIYNGAAVELNRISDVNFRNLTLQAQQTGVIRVQSLSNDTVNNGSNMTIRHCSFKLPVLGYSSAPHIYFSGPSSGKCFTDSLVIDSNRFLGGGYALDFLGGADVKRNKGFVVSNNQVDSCANTGFQFTDFRNAVLVTANTINLWGVNYSNGIVFTNSYNTATNGSHTITRNKINNFTEYGISVAVNDPPAPNSLLIANNAIVSSSVELTIEFTGIRVRMNDWNSTTMVYHNSVVMQGRTENPTFSGIYVDAYNYYIKNNIIAVYNGATIPLYLQNNTAGRVNYNVYYNNSPMGTRKLVRYGSNLFDSTNYKNRNYGGDSSFNYEPSFVSYGSWPPNLALADGCTMTNGVNLLSAVPSDINLTPRPATPKPGAYEFVGYPNNVSVKNIISPLQANVVAPGLQSVRYRVINSGTNPITQYTANYYNNNGPVESKVRTVSLAPCATEIVEFTGVQQVDLVQTNELTVYTTSPNGTADTDRSGDTVRTTIFPPMKGEYIIGPAPSNFLTITDAIDRLNLHGVAGAVTFKIKSGTYQEPVYLDSVRGASPINTITFTSQAAHADSVTILQGYFSGPGTLPLVLQSNAKYYILDKLTFRNNGSVDVTVSLSGNASFDTIRNCVISQPSSTYPGKINISTNNYSGNGVAFLNNIISGAYYPMHVDGQSSTTPIRNLVVSGNTFKESKSMTTEFQYCRGGQFSGNRVYQDSGSNDFFMEFYKNDSGFKVMDNTFYGSAGKWFGVYMLNGQKDSLRRGLVANNSFLNGASLVVDSLSNTDIVHNTIYGPSARLMLDPDGCNKVRILNNIVAGAGAAYELTGTTNLANVQSDYNSVTAYIVSGNTRTPQQFRAAYPALEANSVSVVPGLTSATDLRPNTADSASWSLNGKGTHIGYSLNDYTGTKRPQTFKEGAPDIGAYEFTPVSVPQALTAVPATPVVNGTQTFLLGSDTVAQIKWGAAVPATIIGRLYSGAYPPGADTTTSKSLNMYWDFAAPAGTYNYNISLYYRGPLKGAISYFANMIGAKKDGASPWASYASPVSVVDSVRRILTVNNLTGFSLFTGTDVANPLPVDLLQLEAVACSDHVKVLWSTASEKNVSHFELFGSDNGTGYRLLNGKIAAHGNSSVVRNYQYSDYAAFKNSNARYYKLKTVDLDGNTSWSDVAMVAKSNKPVAQTSVYPNPFDRSISLVVPYEGKTTISITTLQGQVLLSRDAEPQQNIITLSDLGDLAAGVYFITIVQGEHVSTQKVIKQ